MNNGSDVGPRLDPEERDLLARITLQLDRCSAYQRRLDQRRLVLRDAATQLRLGRKAPAVLALIHEQAPDAVTTIQPSLQD